MSRIQIQISFSCNKSRISLSCEAIHFTEGFPTYGNLEGSSTDSWISDNYHWAIKSISTYLLNSRIFYLFQIPNFWASFSDTSVHRYVVYGSVFHPRPNEKFHWINQSEFSFSHFHDMCMNGWNRHLFIIVSTCLFILLLRIVYTSPVILSKDFWSFSFSSINTYFTRSVLILTVRKI